MRPGRLHKHAARVLQPLSPFLRRIENRLLADHSDAAPSPPLLFIVGSPRSGTTLTFQCLTHYFDVIYPSHLAALFPLTPAFGLWLSGLAYGNRPHRAFHSLHGYSLGDSLLGPDEWETLFRKFVIPRLEETSPAIASLAGLPHVGRIVGYMRRVSDKPLVLKVPLAVLHINPLARLLPTSMFLHIERSPLDTARSIYRAKRLEGKPADAMWYIRPPLLRDCEFPTEAHQIAAQVREIDRLTKESFSLLDSSRKQSVRYESLCHSPAAEVERIGRWIGPSVRKRPGAKLPQFTPSRGAPLNDEVIDGILREQLC
jgi:hypothetical protein